MKTVLAVVLMLVSTVAHAQEAPILRGSVINVFPNGSKSIAVINRGSRVGVRVGQRWQCRGELGEFVCRVTEAYEFRSKCLADIDSAQFGSQIGCKLSLAHPAQPPPPRASKVGVREPAPPVVLVHAPGHGLLASHSCVGFTADEQTTYLLSSATGIAPLVDETGLVIERMDLSSGSVVEVARLRPDRVAEGTRVLTELIAREGLLACHTATSRARNADSQWGDPRAWVASHGADEIAFWFEPETQSIYAAMDNGRVAAERVGATSHDLSGVWFIPSSPRHVVRTDRWLAVTVGR